MVDLVIRDGVHQRHSRTPKKTLRFLSGFYPGSDPLDSRKTRVLAANSGFIGPSKGFYSETAIASSHASRVRGLRDVMPPERREKDPASSQAFG